MSAEAVKQQGAGIQDATARGIPLLPAEAAHGLLAAIAAAREAAAVGFEQKARRPPQSNEEAVFRARNPCGGHVEEDAMTLAITLCIAQAMIEPAPPAVLDGSSHSAVGESSSEKSKGTKAENVAFFLRSMRVKVEMPSVRDASSLESKHVFAEPPPPVHEAEESAAIQFVDASPSPAAALAAAAAVTLPVDGGRVFSAPPLPEAPMVEWKVALSAQSASTNAVSGAGSGSQAEPRSSPTDLGFCIGNTLLTAPALGRLSGAVPCRPLGLDCEMVDTSEKDKDLARFTVVGAYGRTLADHYVKPAARITNYEFRFSGITETHMDAATADLVSVRKIFADALDLDCGRSASCSLLDALLPSGLIAGHGLENDLLTLRMTHDRVCDSALQFEHRRGLPSRSGLKYLCERQLGRQIRMAPRLSTEGGEPTVVPHDSAEDATAALELLLRRCAGGPAWGAYHTAWGHVPSYLHNTRLGKSKKGDSKSSAGSGSGEKVQGSAGGKGKHAAGNKRGRPDLSMDEMLGTCVAANEAALAVGLDSTNPPRCVVAGSIGFCK